MFLNNRCQMGAADLFLALNQPAYTYRKLSYRGLVSADCQHAGEKVPPVVCYTSSIELTVAYITRVRWRGPKLDRLGRLYIVMVIEQERRLARTQFRQHHGRCVIALRADWYHPGTRSQRMKQPLYSLHAFLKPYALPGQGRLGAKIA